LVRHLKIINMLDGKKMCSLLIGRWYKVTTVHIWLLESVMWARGFNKSCSEGGKQAGYITYRILYKASTLLSSRAIISFSESTVLSLRRYFLTVLLCKMYCNMTYGLSYDTSTAEKTRWRSQNSEHSTGWTISGSNPSRGKIFFFSKSSNLSLEPTRPHIWLSTGVLTGGRRVKAVGAWCRPLNFIWFHV
jgi:hypothetical protein